MKPMLRQIRDDPRFTLQLVVTDQHLNERFGRTIAEVRKEFDVAAEVDMEQEDDTPKARSRAVGVCLNRMADVLERLAPDICVLYGDRSEVLATAVAATIQGRPIAHVQGGDLTGSVDEQMRHALTKLAHLHFPSTQESAERISRMGEEAWRIHIVGDSHLDAIMARDLEPPEKVAHALDLDLSRPIIIVLQHPETTELDAAYDQMVETLHAVRRTGHQTVVIYPCSDPAYGGTIRAVDELAGGPQFRVFANLDSYRFWGLMAIAAVLVGNSSAGPIESPAFPLPAINIGRRQNNRLCAHNVLHVDHDRDAIYSALDRALHDQAFLAQVATCDHPYGDGHAGRRIVEVLGRTPFDRRLLVKSMTY